MNSLCTVNCFAYLTIVQRTVRLVPNNVYPVFTLYYGQRVGSALHRLVNVIHRNMFLIQDVNNNWLSLQIQISSTITVLYIALKWLQYNPAKSFRFFICANGIVGNRTTVINCPCHQKMSSNVRSSTFWPVHLTQIPISVRIRTVKFESLLSTWRNFASLAIQNAPSEYSDQPARVCRLISITAGRICSNARFLPMRLKCVKVVYTLRFTQLYEHISRFCTFIVHIAGPIMVCAQ